MNPKKPPVLCSVEGCESFVGPKGSHGMCGKHRVRVRRYGDPHYLTSEEQRRASNRLAQPRLGKVKETTYKKHFGRHFHRSVAEQKLGRPLRRGEIVHHIDGDKHNNDPTNLEILDSQSDHAKKHRAFGGRFS